MKIQIHLPRQSEATVEPQLRSDVIIPPKFYKRKGWVPVFYLTTVDARDNEERYMLIISAATKQIRVEKLVEVVPICDTEEADNADLNGQPDDETAED